MSGAQLYTPAEAARILKVRESWLRKKAAARLIPCTFVGRHLRFSEGDLEEIVRSGARPPVTATPRSRTRRSNRT
jgi:excisionase family DNA binding protein